MWHEYDNVSLKQSLKQIKEDLSLNFEQDTHINTLIEKLVVFTDSLLVTLFHKHHLEQDNRCCLMALGSYGRRELLLYSDIDLLLLHDPKADPAFIDRIQNFIQDCWDIGLEISHQITTVDACAKLANGELSVISSLLDMRFIGGDPSLMDELLLQTHPLHMWRSHDFFYAKQREQYLRYEKYGETAYNLEPNVKNGPGGLRDLQVILAIGKRHFGIKKLSDGIRTGFITEKEFEDLAHCQHFLWRVRFALHIVAQKNEDRLLFDHQMKLAKIFGYQDGPDSLGIEQFMKVYFNIIKHNRELNEMLLQWFEEAILYSQKQTIIPLDESFQLSNHYIEVTHPQVFAKKPETLITLFLWIANNPMIQGVRANTIRLVRRYHYLITPSLRSKKSVTQTFMDILKTEHSPFPALQRMSRYGVLGDYLDCFAAVTGQMQYDLFHVYTVDQHTLFVIRNIGRFLEEEYKQQFPLCAKLILSIEQREILYLAALFHDIAKGQGGDHSQLGAIEAEHFATRHHLDTTEKELLVWLVQNHLLMSQTAQRKDIYDPKIISDFCSLFPKRGYLDYLYLLTVADICGTNPSLWNAWRDSLLKELYLAANQMMGQKDTLVSEADRITLRKEEAMTLLINEGMKPTLVNRLWNTFKGKYFLHESPDSIATQTKAILNAKQCPVILIMPHHTQGGLEVFVYMPHRDERFIITTTVLTNHHVTIQEANILTTDNHYDLDTYIILDENNQAFFNERRILNIQKALMKHLTDPNKLPSISQVRLSRVKSHFILSPQITFTQDKKNTRTSLFLIAADRPGLLATISRIFLSEHIYLHNAKISTAGERVEDVFYISNSHGKRLTQQEQRVLRYKLKAGLKESKRPLI